MGNVKPPLPEIAFRNVKTFETWLRRHHAASSGIWLQLAKKDSGIPSVTPTEAVETAICFGWIDGQIRPRDAETYLVRYGPRAKRSIWSKINRGRVAGLVAQGRMQPAGLLEVDRAQQDGRWEAAYDSARTATVPPDPRPGSARPGLLRYAERRESLCHPLPVADHQKPGSARP